MKRTLLIIKPDGVKRKLIGVVLKHIIDAGFTVIGMKMLWPDADMAARFYEIHKGKPFFDKLVDFISSGPIVACCLSHPQGPQKLREVVGATDPEQADSGTIRSRYGTSVRENVVHASAPDEDPEREIRFFFSDRELFNY